MLGDYMEANELVRHMLKESNVTIKVLSIRLDMSYQTLRNKLTSNYFTFAEIARIADTLGYDIKAVKKS